MKKSLQSKTKSFWEPFFSFDFAIEILLLVIIFLTPVIFDRRLGIVFSGTKIAWLRFLVIITVSAWALKLVITKQHRFVRTPLDWPILGFLLTTTIATLASVHPFVSFAGFYGRFEGLSTWYILGLLFFITTNYIHSPAQLKRIVATVIPAAGIMSIYGIIQRHELDPYLWGGVVTWQRVIGTIGQPNFLAAYVLMAFFLTLYLFFEERNVSGEIDWFAQLPILGYLLFSQVIFVVMIYALDAKDVIAWYFAFLLMTIAALLFAFNYEKIHPLVGDLVLGTALLLDYICLLYTQSRGGYMGFFTGAVLFTVLAGRKVLFRNWKKLAILGFLILLVSAITMTRPEFSPFERFASEITVKKGEQVPSEAESRLELKGAAGSRGETWKSAFKIISDYPFFGVGPEVLKMVFPRYETELFRFKEAFHVKQDRCHNETFDVPVTKGLISFFLYLWIIFILFREGVKRISGEQRILAAGLLSAILAYLVQNQFSFGVIAITSLFWVMWGMVMVLEQEGKTESGKKWTLEEVPWFLVSVVVLVAAFLIYISFLSFRGDIYYKSGKTYLEMRNFSSAVEELKKSLQVYPFEGTTISHLGIAYLNQGAPYEAIKYLTYGTQVDPYNADNFFMLSRIYLSFYDRGNKEAMGEALRMTEIALKIDPYYAEAYDTKGQILERQEKLEEAAKFYAKAFEVNPTLPDTMQRLETTFRKLGKIKELRQMLEDAYQKFPDNIDLFKALERLKT